MRRIRIAALTVIPALALFGATAGAPATDAAVTVQAVARAPLTHYRAGTLTAGAYCDNGNKLCIGTYSSGVAMDANPNGAAAQLTFNLQADDCNAGHVSSSLSCPFPKGSGLNADYRGDPIVTIQSGAHGYCIADPSISLVKDVNCSDNGVLWVVAKVPDKIADYFINKYQTNLEFRQSGTLNQFTNTQVARAEAAVGDKPFISFFFRIAREKWRCEAC
jgi:hypothetical protein